MEVRIFAESVFVSARISKWSLPPSPEHIKAAVLALVRAPPGLTPRQGSGILARPEQHQMPRDGPAESEAVAATRRNVCIQRRIRRVPAN